MSDVKEVPIGALFSCVIIGIVGTLVVEHAFLPDSSLRAQREMEKLEQSCEMDKQGMEKVIEEQKKAHNEDHAEIDKLGSDLKLAEEQVKYWEQRRGAKVAVPEWAQQTWQDCADRWKQCEWESSTIKYRAKREGEWTTEIYNKCEVEVQACDRLIDSVTDPRGY